MSVNNLNDNARKQNKNIRSVVIWLLRIIMCMFICQLAIIHPRVNKWRQQQESDNIRDKWHWIPNHLSSKHQALSHCWFNVGPASQTLDQHWTNNGSMPRVCRDTLTHPWPINTGLSPIHVLLKARDSQPHTPWYCNTNSMLGQCRICCINMLAAFCQLGLTMHSV